MCNMAQAIFWKFIIYKILARLLLVVILSISGAVEQDDFKNKMSYTTVDLMAEHLGIRRIKIFVFCMLTFYYAKL